MTTVRKRSQKQESKIAETFNARTIIASGALWASKGDVRHDKLLIECKTTEKDFYSVTTKVWEKIKLEALKDGARIPLLVVDLQDKTTCVIFRPQDFTATYSQPYEVIPRQKGLASFRLKSNEPCLFTLKPRDERFKRMYTHVLMCLSIEEFLNTYEGEI